MFKWQLQVQMCFESQRVLPCGFLGLRRGHGHVRLRPTQPGVFSSRERFLIHHTVHFPTSQLRTAACGGCLFALFYDGNTEQHVFDLFLQIWHKNNWTQIDGEGSPSYVINKTVTQGCPCTYYIYHLTE